MIGCIEFSVHNSICMNVLSCLRGVFTLVSSLPCTCIPRLACVQLSNSANKTCSAMMQSKAYSCSTGGNGKTCTDLSEKCKTANGIRNL